MVRLFARHSVVASCTFDDGAYWVSRNRRFICNIYCGFNCDEQGKTDGKKKSSISTFVEEEKKSVRLFFLLKETTLNDDDYETRHN